MSKMVIKNKTKKCTGCKQEAGILAITLPSNRFLRPRTESEAKHIAELQETNNLNAGDLWLDKNNRKVKYCPQCIKPIREQLGYDGFGDPIHVSLWGQKR